MRGGGGGAGAASTSGFALSDGCSRGRFVAFTRKERVCGWYGMYRGVLSTVNEVKVRSKVLPGFPYVPQSFLHGVFLYREWGRREMGVAGRFSLRGFEVRCAELNVGFLLSVNDYRVNIRLVAKGKVGGKLTRSAYNSVD